MSTAASGPEEAVRRALEAVQNHRAALDLSRLELTCVPDSIPIEKLRGLISLDLSNNQLTEMPGTIGQIASLTILDLSSNRLVGVPATIGELGNLTELRLSNNGLTTLPRTAGQLRRLSALDLSSNRLAEVPDAIEGLTGLTTLNLSNNRLTELPDSIGKLARLITLNLYHNELATISGAINKLTNLTMLDLSSNRLVEMPDAIGELGNLTELHLGNNRLVAFPSAISRLRGLTALDLSNNQLTEISDAIGDLTCLTTLDLGYNGLTTLPDAIGLLARLAKLYLSGNGLTTLQDAFGQLEGLTALNVSGNGLTELPDAIGQLQALTELHLGNNHLCRLPDAIGQLKGLITLNVSGNGLTELPDAIGELTSLSWLNVSGNGLAALPDAVGRLNGLTELYLSGNQRLASPPAEVRAQGTQAVLAFLRARATSSIERWDSKLLVVGEAMVGKTSLVKRLLGEEFDPDERQTHGVRVRPLLLPHPDRPDVKMALDVWDFGGQLEYRATQRFYLTDRALFVLVWNSRARAVDGKISAWLDAITARAPNSPILIVATHCDEHSPASPLGDLIGRYPRILGIHAVDSRTKLGINELREAIIHHAACLPLMGTRWPAAWDTAARSIDELPGLTTTTHRFFTHLARAGVREPATQHTIARILHDLGHISYFADIPDLAAKIILRPEWLDARITQVIDSESVTDAGGILSRAERHRLWGELADDEDDPDLPDRLIRMMEVFDLAYRVGDAETSQDVALIVDRLPDTPPFGIDRAWREKADRSGVREIAIIYKLASRQAGIPTWFIAREHRYTTSLNWRYGALLHDRDPYTPAWALLTDDGREQPTLTLRVVGAYPVRFLSVLTEALDTIIEARYPGLIEQQLVPCACTDDSGQRCAHAFTLRELLAEATADEPDADHKIRCPDSRRRIEAAAMLDGLRGTGLTAQLDALQQQIAAQSSTLTAIDARQQAQLNGIRTLLEHRASAGVSCPGIFTIEQAGRTGLLRSPRITVTLWCEWPSGPHPVEGKEARYTITKVPQALIRYLPYLRLLITVLGLAAPALNAVGGTLGERAKAEIAAVAKTLEYIEQHADITALVPGHDSPGASARKVRAETGADFRALRDMLIALDPKNAKNWGGLSPISRPEDRRIIYLCPHHLHELDYPFMGTSMTGGT